MDCYQICPHQRKTSHHFLSVPLGWQPLILTYSLHYTSLNRLPFCLKNIINKRCTGKFIWIGLFVFGSTVGGFAD